MEITLKQNEIEQGIVSYLNEQGISTGGTTVTITLTAGRKGSGHSAKVEITPEMGTLGIAKEPSDPAIGGDLSTKEDTAETPEELFA